MGLTAGARFGPYEVVASIGAGGMGEVYRARDTRLHRDIALKILPPRLVADPARRERFVQEARAASALEHPILTLPSFTGGRARRRRTHRHRSTHCDRLR